MDRRTVLTSSLAATAVAALKPLRACAAESRSLLDFIPREHHAAIRAGGSQFDCAPALQRAIDTTSDAGETLVVPAGTYVLVPATPINDEDAPPHLPRRRAHAFGHDHSRRARLDSAHSRRDLERSCPAQHGHVLHRPPDCRHRDERLDAGHERPPKPHQPGRGQRSYNRSNQSHILVSAPAAGSRHASTTRWSERCTFLGTAGVCCIVMAQSNVAGVRLGRGWRLIENEFRDNGSRHR
jgi:hypothetical protein